MFDLGVRATCTDLYLWSRRDPDVDVRVADRSEMSVVNICWDATVQIYLRMSW
jgi:hypothetical protein